VIHRVLVIAAWICCGLVIASFGLFTRDQLAGASEQQTTEIVAGAPNNPTPVAVVRHHGQPRRFIDGAAADLTAPFRSLLHTDSVWVTEITETILALLVYGLGIGLLARYVRGGLAG
jgi:DNA-binding transcriptional LysR family regulator